MLYTQFELWISIIIIGIFTVIIRALFLFYLPKNAENPIVQRGMQAVPATMLVALVIPFTLFVDNTLSIWRPEVIAMLLSIPILLISKKYGLGLFIATILYILVDNLLF